MRICTVRMRITFIKYKFKGRKEHITEEDEVDVSGAETVKKERLNSIQKSKSNTIPVYLLKLVEDDLFSKSAFQNHPQMEFRNSFASRKFVYFSKKTATSIWFLHIKV